MILHTRRDNAPGREVRGFFDQDEIQGIADWRRRIRQGLRESQPNTLARPLKTLFTGPELLVARDVTIPQDITHFIESLKLNLGEASRL